MYTRPSNVHSKTYKNYKCRDHAYLHSMKAPTFETTKNEKYAKNYNQTLVFTAILRYEKALLGANFQEKHKIWRSLELKNAYSEKHLRGPVKSNFDPKHRSPMH